MDENSEGGDQPHPPPNKVRGSDGQSIGKVVRKVSGKVEVGRYLDLRRRRGRAGLGIIRVGGHYKGKER